MNDSRLTIAEIKDLLQSLLSEEGAFTLNESKHTIEFVDTDNSTCNLTLPLVLPKFSGGSADELIQQIADFKLAYTIVLIQAGAAAIGYYEGNECLRHKVIKKYMVRKKQGKSQIKHLKSKGKSRLGSRIRLRNTITFFEEINQILTDWDVTTNSETILMSLPINLQNLMFKSAIPVPFEKNDPRIKKVPVDVRVPSFKELGHINWIVSRGVLSVDL